MSPDYAQTTGFPSPADDYTEAALDFNAYLIAHPSATYCMRMGGDAMAPGITDGDILVVDRSLEAAHNRVIVAILDGELTIRRLLRDEGGGTLQADNPSYPAVRLSTERAFEVWGVVSFVIHRMLQP
jgi:DNA polymerase V